MSKGINHFKLFFFYFYICGIDAFSKVVRSGILAKILNVVSIVACKILTPVIIVMYTIVIIIIFDDKSPNGSYDIMHKGYPLMLQFGLICFYFTSCQAIKNKQNLQVLYLHLQLIDLSKNYFPFIC